MKRRREKKLKKKEKQQKRKKKSAQVKRARPTDGDGAVDVQAKKKVSMFDEFR